MFFICLIVISPIIYFLSMCFVYYGFFSLWCGVTRDLETKLHSFLYTKQTSTQSIQTIHKNEMNQLKDKVNIIE